MRAAGIDIGTTTISGVVLDTEAKKVLKAKTIQNGSFIKAEHDWEQIQDVALILTKACALRTNCWRNFLRCRDDWTDRTDAWNRVSGQRGGVRQPIIYLAGWKRCAAGI